VKGEDVLLIGIDGGATEAKAHAAACDDLDNATAFELRSEAASRIYPPAAGFVPVPVMEQFTQRDAGKIELTAGEVAQGKLWVAAAAEAAVEVARTCGARCVLVGMGMPGLKTPDGRGINVINNGPRIPDYLQQLEQHITAAELELAAPVAALGSDADYCGLGEEYAAEGLFRDVGNAYYVGCGTGVADAMKLHGKLVPFDAAKSWLQKSWQMPSALGATFEKLVSAKSLNRVFEEMTEVTKRRSDEATEGACATASQSPFPEAAAIEGNPVAVAWMDTAALVMAELIFERLWTIKNGRAEAPHHGEAYLALDANHEYRGTLLDRVVIGQRLGMIYADARFADVFSMKLDKNLATLIADSDDAELIAACLASDGKALQPGFVCASKLRAAPALGAAVAAVRSHM